MTHFARTAVLLAALGAAAPAVAQDIIVVVHGQANDPFWSVVKNGVEAAAEDTGANVEFRSPETFDMVQMAQMIDAAVNQEPDGLVVSIPDADALGPSIKRAVEAGIPVISMNSGSDYSAELGALLHVGQNEYDAGLEAGEKMYDMGGTVGICVNHEVGNVALDLRCEGFGEGFGGPVEVIPTSNDPAEVQSKIQATLERNPEIDTIMGLGALVVGEPALAAVEAVGRTGDVMVASFDLSASFLEAVSAGNAIFAIDQQQFLQGYLPVSILALHAKYGLVPGGDMPSGPNMITKEKADQVVELSAQGIR